MDNKTLMINRCRVAVTWNCGRHGRAWSDDLRPCPVCGSRHIVSVQIPGRGQIATMERTETGVTITFEDGTSAILGILPQEVQ